MANKNSADSGMEEYKMQDESNVPEYSEPQDVPSLEAKKKLSLRGKRLLVPILLIVVIILVYQFLSWYSNKKGQSVVKQEEVVAQKVVQNTATLPAGATLAATPASTAKRAEVVGEGDALIQQKLESLATKTENNAEQLNRLKDSATQTQATLARLNQDIKSLSQAVDGISISVQQAAIATKEKAKPKKVKRAVKKDLPPAVIYHLKAIVPGLAWVESSAGQTVAIRVGDELQGYGTVRLISPKQGMVITSTGTIIQYGVNDF